jgi:membrane-bound serine protease (ClpP class)
MTMRSILQTCALAGLSLLLAATLLAHASSVTPKSGGFVAQIDLDGPIGPAAAEYVQQASARAQREGARGIVLRLDTPGGLSGSMRKIISDILASRIPVIGYVSPGGARAASAGTYILYACHVAAMAPATHLGAATPVSIGGSTPMPSSLAKPAAATSTAQAEKAADNATHGDAEAHKVLNDAIAYIRSLAQLRGRNADWAAKAVRGAATLTASEALDKHVVDLIAPDTASLLRQIDGRRIRIKGHEQVLHLAGLEVRDYAPGWRTRFLAIITNPTIAYLLLLAGIFGLVLEAFHPGAMLPGIAGAICLLIGLYALQLLPVDYAGLALMALGVGLVIAEVIMPTLGVIGLGGVVAFTVGSIMLFKTGGTGFGISLGMITGLALCGIGTLAALLLLVMRARRTRSFNGDHQLLDHGGELLEALAPESESWARINGERWRVRSENRQALPAGTRVHARRRDGLVLWVDAESRHE